VRVCVCVCVCVRGGNQDEILKKELPAVAMHVSAAADALRAVAERLKQPLSDAENRAAQRKLVESAKSMSSNGQQAPRLGPLTLFGRSVPPPQTS
jgi:hypothetical protein